MIDCSELSKTIYDMVRHHVKSGKSVDAAIKRMVKDHPALNENRVLESMAEASTKHGGYAEDFQKVLNEAKKIGGKVASLVSKVMRTGKKAKEPVTLVDVQNELATLQKGLEGVDGKLDATAKKFARFFVEQGDTNRDSVVGKVWEELKEFDQDITERRVKDAISDYGKFREPSSEPTDITLTGMRSELQKLSAIEDVESGGVAAPTGNLRQTPTEEYRTLLKLLNNAKKNSKKYADLRSGKHLKTIVETTITRLENQKTDLEKELREEKRTPRAKYPEIKDNPKINELREQIKGLKKLHKDMFPKAPKTSAQRTAESIKVLGRALRAVKSRLAWGRYTTEVSKPIQTNAERDALLSELAEYREMYDRNNPNTQAAKSARKQIDVLNGHLRNGTLPVKKAATAKTTENLIVKELQSNVTKLKQRLKDSPQALQKAIDTEVAATVRALEKRIAALEKERDTGVRPVKTAKEKTTTPEIEALKAFRDALQSEVNQERRLASSILSAKKSIQDYMDRLESGKYEPKQPPPVVENTELKGLREKRKLWQKRWAANNPNAPNVRAARERRAELEKHLEDGTLPEPRTRTGEPSSQYAMEDRAAIKELLRELADSPQGRAKKIASDINNLMKNLADVDYAPAVRQEMEPRNKKERDLLYARNMLRRQLHQKVENMKPKSVTLEVMNWLGLARAVKTAFDISLGGRQGILALVSHPKALGPSLYKDMFKALGSEQGYYEVLNKYETREDAPWIADSGTHVSTNSGDIGAREEAVATDLLDRLMGWVPEAEWKKKIKKILTTLAIPVRASERAYVAGTASIRSNYFTLLHENVTIGRDSDRNERQVLGEFVNTVTGRSDFGAFNNSAVAMNTMFFAPRYVWSRFQYIFGAFSAGETFMRDKEGRAKLNREQKSRLRKVLLNEYKRQALAISAVLSMIYFAWGDDDDVEVGIDPRSSDFGKVRIGNTRVDFLGGTSQSMVVMARTADALLDAAMGKDISPEDKSYWRPGYGRDSAYDMLSRFMRTKFAPPIGAGIDFMSGENVIGEESGKWDIPRNLVMPLSLEDIKDTMEADGYTKGTIFSVLAVLGVGIQVHEPRQKKSKYPTLSD